VAALSYGEPVDWQQLISLGIVAGAAALLVWGKLRPQRGLSTRGHGHCGCSRMNSPSSGGSLRYEARKGQRARLIVRGS
jgi:hypothetical protein